MHWNNFDQGLEATITLPPRVGGVERVNAFVQASSGSGVAQHLTTYFLVKGKLPPDNFFPLPGLGGPPPTFTVSPRSIRSGGVATFQVVPIDSPGPHEIVVLYRSFWYRGRVPMGWLSACRCYKGSIQVRPRHGARRQSPPAIESTEAVALVTKPGTLGTNWRVTTTFTVRTN